MEKLNLVAAVLRNKARALTLRLQISFFIYFKPFLSFNFFYLQMVIVVGDVQLVRMLLRKFLKFTLASVVSFLLAFAKKNDFIILILFF